MQAPIIQISGKPVEMQPVSFRKARKLAPMLEAQAGQTGNMEIRVFIVEVLALLLDRDVEELNDAMTYLETGAAAEKFSELLQWVGLIEANPSGEARAASSPLSASTI